MSLNSNRDRLPTLFEVLNRMSSPPVDLWTFYVFMRENYKGVEYLDFWLEAANHLSLCKKYVRTLQASGSLPRNSDDPRISGHSYHGNHSSGSHHRSSGSNGGRNSRPRGSPSSSVLFNMLREGVSDSEADNRFSQSTHGQLQAHLDQDEDQFWDTQEGRGDQVGPGFLPINLPAASSRSNSDNSPNSYTFPQNSTSAQPPAVPVPPVASATSAANRMSQQSYYEDYVPDEKVEYRRTGNYEHQGYGPQATPESAAPRSSIVRPEYLMDSEPVIRDSHRFSHHRRTSTGSALLAGMDLDVTAHRHSGHHSGSRSVSGSGHEYPSVPGQYSQVPGGTPPEGFSPIGTVDPANNVFSEKPLPDGKVTRDQIHTSVQRIVDTYFTPGSAREIALPGSMAASIRLAAQGRGKDNPAIFDEAREYVFDALEREAYPAFLATRALANIQSSSSLIRLLVGLVGLFGGFWLGFVFILLNWGPRAQKCWVILPFGVGWYLIFSSLYNLDPILGILGYTEMGRFGLSRIGEPYVRKLIFKRSLFALAITIFVAACFVVIFVFVPGHRL